MAKFAKTDKQKFSNAIFMVPMPIGINSIVELQTPKYIELLKDTIFWVAENSRTFRRFISGLQLGINIDNLQIFELERDYKLEDLSDFLSVGLKDGNVGVVSEAGLPGMADPGAAVALWGHKNDVKVIPITGPGSIYLALSASGLNGQQFTFHGYPPVKEDELKKFLVKMSATVAQTGYTQIWIETPYRSDRMLQRIVNEVNPNLQLCIACALHSPDGWIKTQSISNWRNDNAMPGKNPCVFLVGRS